MASHSSNGRRENINLGSESETYNRVHHDLDSAAANRKPIVTESKYKVNVAEPGVDDLHLAEHHFNSKSESTGSKSTGTGAPKNTTTGSTTKTTTTSTTKNTTTGSKSSSAGPAGGTPGSKNTSSANQQKGQFIAKPDVYSDDEGDDDEGGFPWVPVLGGAAALAGVVAGLFYYKKQNPEVDQQFRRSVEDADHRVKGALGSGERRVKDFIGSGQQKFKELVGRGGDHVDGHVDDDGHSHDSHPGQGRGHSLNPFNHSSGGDGDLYKVKQGDNLSKIAKKSGKKSWHEVAEENPSIRNPNLIYPGDRIRL